MFSDVKGTQNHIIHKALIKSSKTFRKFNFRHDFYTVVLWETQKHKSWFFYRQKKSCFLGRKYKIFLKSNSIQLIIQIIPMSGRIRDLRIKLSKLFLWSRLKRCRTWLKLAFIRSWYIDKLKSSEIYLSRIFERSKNLHFAIFRK